MICDNITRGNNMAEKEWDYKDIVFKAALIIGGLLILKAVEIFTFSIGITI